MRVIEKNYNKSVVEHEEYKGLDINDWEYEYYDIRKELQQLWDYKRASDVDMLRKLAIQYLREARVFAIFKLDMYRKQEKEPQLLEQNKKMILITRNKIEEETERLNKLKQEYQELDELAQKLRLELLSENIKNSIDKDDVIKGQQEKIKQQEQTIEQLKKQIKDAEEFMMVGVDYE